MKKIIIAAIIISITALFIIIKTDNEGKIITQKRTLTVIKSLKKEDLQKLAKKKVYFAHMSVGYNILAGVQSIIKKNNLSIKLVEVKDKKADLTEPAIYHSKVGANIYPLKKITDYKKKIQKIYGNKINIAFLKFCYIDINVKTDINKVFSTYQDTLKVLQKKYPKTIFVHMTVPLNAEGNVTIGKKIKDFIKGIIGKQKYKDKMRTANIARKSYNDLLRKTYKKNRLFDLAKFESTTEKGIEKFSLNNSIKHNFLLKEYTYDGGHLNKRGREFIAEQLLIFLTKVK